MSKTILCASPEHEYMPVDKVHNYMQYTCPVCNKRYCNFCNTFQCYSCNNSVPCCGTKQFARCFSCLFYRCNDCLVTCSQCGSKACKEHYYTYDSRILCTSCVIKNHQQSQCEN